MLRSEAKTKLDAVEFLTTEMKEKILSQMEFDQEEIKAKDLKKYDCISFSVDGNKRTRGIVLDPSIKGVNNKEYILLYTPDGYELVSAYSFDHLDNVAVSQFKGESECDLCDHKGKCDKEDEDEDDGVYLSLEEFMDYLIETLL